MSEIKTIEQGAKEFLDTQTAYDFDVEPYQMGIAAYREGAKHQKELSDAREKLLMNVISEMRAGLNFYTDRNNWADYPSAPHPEADIMYCMDYKFDETALNTLSSVAKKLEGL